MDLGDDELGDFMRAADSGAPEQDVRSALDWLTWAGASSEDLKALLGSISVFATGHVVSSVAHLLGPGTQLLGASALIAGGPVAPAAVLAGSSSLTMGGLAMSGRGVVLPPASLKITAPPGVVAVTDEGEGTASATVVATRRLRSRPALSRDKQIAIWLLALFVTLFIVIKGSVAELDLPAKELEEANELTQNLGFLITALGTYLGYRALKK